MVLVTGHYDSINSNVLKNWADTSGAAPGANDDASGVAISLECARALSKPKFPGTIVFAAVAGEEQGLVGSAHLAKLAKDEGWDLEAVLNQRHRGRQHHAGRHAAAEGSGTRIFRGRSTGGNSRGGAAYP